MDGYVTTSEAAAIIGCNASRVRQLLGEKRLQGERVGRDWLVRKASAQAYAKTERKPGRKSKPKRGKTA
jgi:excisionase family DNA binding protein